MIKLKDTKEQSFMSELTPMSDLLKSEKYEKFRTDNKEYIRSVYKKMLDDRIEQLAKIKISSENKK